MGKSVRLEAKGAGDGRKFYTVEIVGACDDGYLVNYTYGAVGGNTKTGTKTPKAVELTEAEKVFDALVKEKMTGSSHYQQVLPDGWTEERINHVLRQEQEPTGRKCFNPRLLIDVDPERVLALVEDDDWWVQIKHDGDRVQLQAEKGVVTLFSARSGRVRECPNALADMFREAYELLVLDGELVGDVCHVFDVLFAGGDDMRDHTYQTRYQLLEAWATLAWRDPVRLVRAAKTHEDKAALILKAREDNQEGVCCINRKSKYTEGRSGDNVRLKFKASASVIVGKRHATKRSVEALLYGGAPIGTVPIPVNREFPPEGAVIEVEYLYCQSRLVQTVYKGLRTDVAPEACTRAQLKFKRTEAA